MKKLFLLTAGCLFTLCVLAQTGAQPSGTGKVVLDNPNVKVTSYVGKPGKDMCGIGKHSHGPHLTVLLTDATITVTQGDGKVVTQKAVAGTTFWNEAETHTVINSGKEVCKAQIIEYKKPK